VTASFLNTNKFTPVPDDGDFFQEDLMDLLKSSAPKPTLISLTENEALLFGNSFIKIIMHSKRLF
jgi:hypothetical protein